MVIINPLLSIVSNTLYAKCPYVDASYNEQYEFYNYALEAYADFFRMSHHDDTTRIPKYLDLRKSNIIYEVKEYQDIITRLEGTLATDSQLVALLRGEFPLDAEGKCIDEKLINDEQEARASIAAAKSRFDTYIKDNPNASISKKIYMLLSAYCACTCELYCDYNFRSYDVISKDKILYYTYDVMEWLQFVPNKLQVY